jgi:hypothetical protein
MIATARPSLFSLSEGRSTSVSPWRCDRPALREKRAGRSTRYRPALFSQRAGRSGTVFYHCHWKATGKGPPDQCYMRKKQNNYCMFAFHCHWKATGKGPPDQCYMRKKQNNYCMFAFQSRKGFVRRGKPCNVSYHWISNPNGHQKIPRRVSIGSSQTFLASV